MGSQTHLASRSEVVSIYKCPQNFGGPPQKFGAQKHQFFSTFSRLPHSTPPTKIDYVIVTLYFHFSLSRINLKISVKVTATNCIL